MKKFSVQVGDKVAFSVQFLKSIGMGHSDMARARGVVESVRIFGSDFSLAKIKWSNYNSDARVNVQNLAKVGPNRRFCNV